MGKSLTVIRDIEPVWDNIKVILSEVKEKIKNLNPRLTQSTVLACTELLENSIKYGEHKNSPSVHFVLEIADSNMKILVSNKLSNEDSIRVVKGFIDLIRISNIEQLYIQRLREIINNPRSGYSQMGLYRIVHEAKFNLDYSITNDILTITASRQI